MAPVGETERELTRIWGDVLGVGDVGATDNFFDLGGHSLKVTKLVALVHQRLGVQVPLAAVFRCPSARALAQYLLDAARYGVSLADEAMVSLGGAPGAPPIFALPPGTGDVLGYMPLAAELPAWRFHAFNFVEADSRLSDYADLVSSVTDGPAVLFGYSSGGNLAFHVAAELERRGRVVSDIIMVDSGRRIAPYPFVEDAVMQVAQDFLNHDTIRPYCGTPVLRDKAIRRVVGSYRFLSSTTDLHSVRANIHVLLCANQMMDAVYDGQVIARIEGWRDATSGVFRMWPGLGEHNLMLYDPALPAKAAVLREILALTAAGAGA